MKEMYHICYTSHNEVMFRSDEDHGRFLNLLALKSWSTGTEVISESEMSTHVHLCVITSNPVKFASILRMSYTKYFNRKYRRNGRMGEPGLFILPVLGINHQIALNNYVLRNGLHHNAASTAFGYRYCSVREAFASEIFLARPAFKNSCRNDIRSVLPKNSDFPDSFQIDEKGVILRSSFMEIRQLERMYITPRSYLYQMNRLTDESWGKEQEKDGTGKPICLEDIEIGYCGKDISSMLKNESGRYYRPDRLQDLDVCHIIDKEYIPRYGMDTVYGLSDTKKDKIIRDMLHELHIPEIVSRRCLAR